METLAATDADTTATSLSARVVDLPPTPEAISDIIRDALASLERGQVQDVTVDALVHESTRVALNWMGTGDRSSLDALLQSLRSTLVEAGLNPVRLSGLTEKERLAVKVLELGRVVSVYLRSNNASRDVSVLGGAKRARWRAVMAWACGLDAPFTAADLRGAGFYTDRRASASDALNALALEGLLSRIENAGVTYSVTLVGRNACRAAVDQGDMAEWTALPQFQATLDAQREAVGAEREAIKAERAAIEYEHRAIEFKRRALDAQEEQIAAAQRAFAAEKDEWLEQVQEAEIEMA